MSKRLGHLINGEIVEGGSNAQIPLHNPATGELLAQVAVAGEMEVNLAVEAACKAGRDWAATTPMTRARHLFRYKSLLDQHIDELAEIVTREHGKTLADARGSVQRGIEVVEFVCGIPSLLRGDFSARVGTGVDSYSMRQPLGVCVGITPFNFPAMIPLWLFPMAIACGNTFVLKPSEKDPSVCLRLVELLHEAGVPKGVVNIVNGDKSTVELLVAHPDVKAVSSVGSTPVAKSIFDLATKHYKRVQALGGAKNHAIVMPDANLEDAANALVSAAYGSAGERCMAISAVVVVGDDTADQLIELMQPKIEQLTVGPGTDEVDMGPLISLEHRDRVNDYVEQGIKSGATLVLDRRETGLDKGYYLGPCLFDQVTPEMSIYQDEIFGPVLIVVRVKNYQAALQLVCDNPYGNGTAIFTSNAGLARRFARDANIGMVGINLPIPVPVAWHSFGGWKQSLFGDINMYGEEGVRFYTKLKTVTERWPEQTTEQHSLHMPTHK